VTAANESVSGTITFEGFGQTVATTGSSANPYVFNGALRAKCPRSFGGGISTAVEQRHFTPSLSRASRMAFSLKPMSA
jgi:hypothetical protein